MINKVLLPINLTEYVLQTGDGSSPGEPTAINLLPVSAALLLLSPFHSIGVKKAMRAISTRFTGGEGERDGGRSERLR